jgi:hypothetical protein
MSAAESIATTVVDDARLLEGLGYWRRKAAGRAMPRRADIDPTEIPKLLPHVRLVEVVGTGQYRYRLVGTEVRKLHGPDPTGRYVHETVTGAIGARIIALYDECVHSRRAIYFETEFVDDEASKLHRRSKVIFAPLSFDGTAVDQILVFQVTLGASRLVNNPRDAYRGRYNEIAYAPL